MDPRVGGIEHRRGQLILLLLLPWRARVMIWITAGTDSDTGAGDKVRVSAFHTCMYDRALATKISKY